MIIKNGLLLTENGFVREDIKFGEIIEETGDFSSSGGSPDALDASGCFVAPGLIDIHTHGIGGMDFSDGRAEDIPEMRTLYARRGVTSVLPTIMTMGKKDMIRAAGAYAESLENCVISEMMIDFVPDGCAFFGCRVPGLHVEGPFLSVEKKGAQAGEFFAEPDLAFFDDVDEASGGRISTVTVAPEIPGAMDFIRSVSKRAAVSLGHSAADYETALEAFKAGATRMTHTFNGMRDIEHRSPGIVPAGRERGAFAELICDGMHIHPAVVRLAFDMFKEKTVLVSDSLRCCGMPDGAYMSGGQCIELSGGRAVLAGTDVLAGSAIDLMECVRRAVSFGVPLEDALRAASAAPAEAVGLSGLGRIKEGFYADLIVLDEDLGVKAVYIGGRRMI